MPSPANGVTPLTEAEVPLRTGPPTREELAVYYPAKFTWIQIKMFVNSGDLDLLKRDRKLQKRYEAWAVEITSRHGSMVDYLIKHQLRWGEPDTSPLLTSSLDVGGSYESLASASNTVSANEAAADPPPYFCWETPAQHISINQNNWPYSVPPEVEHILIWTKVPIYHSDLVDNSVKSRIDLDGLWGFTGNDSPPPSPSLLPSHLPALAEWGVTKEQIVVSASPTKEEAVLIERAGKEVHRYIKNRWSESDWETAWFVNPPRLQSVPGLAHIHVFARRKK